MNNTVIFILLGALGAFFMAFNNGANDVANAFGSAVGSKALKMKTAVVIASLVTFAGAILLGGRVATKLISGLVPPSTFNDPRQYMISMITVLLASGIFVLVSTLTSLPVSSSQAIVGSLTGISIMLAGWESVNWHEISRIVSGWIISPVVAALLAIILCKFIEGLIIGKNPGMMDRVKRWLPLVVSITICGGIFALFTITSLKSSIGIDSGESFLGLTQHELSNRKISALDSLQYSLEKMKDTAEEAKNSVYQKKNNKEAEIIADKLQDEFQEIKKSADSFIIYTTKRAPAPFYAKRWQVLIFCILLFFPLYFQMKKFIHRWLKHHDEEAGIQRAFQNLQVGTSCYVAFAIGSNDVANSISPVLAICIVAKAGGIPETFNSGMPLWILVLGGFGMAFGITLLGNRVMKTVGERLTKINNARGYCIDFAVATSVVGASACGIPVSTTHAATGAVVGSGLTQGKGAVKFGMLGKIAIGWLITIPMSCILTVVLFKVLTFVFSFIS